MQFKHLSPEDWIELLRINNIDLSSYGTDTGLDIHCAIQQLASIDNIRTTLPFRLVIWCSVDSISKLKVFYTTYKWARYNRECLPSSGGDPIKRYLAYHKAIRKGDLLGDEEYKRVAKEYYHVYDNTLEDLKVPDEFQDYLPMIYTTLTKVVDPTIRCFGINAHTLRFYKSSIQYEMQQIYDEGKFEDSVFDYSAYVTFNQCKLLGGSVRKGSKATKFHYGYYTNGNNGQVLRRKYINLFHLSQCIFDDESKQILINKLNTIYFSEYNFSNISDL